MIEIHKYIRLTAKLIFLITGLIPTLKLGMVEVMLYAFVN
jgi:hypothetical protein